MTKALSEFLGTPSNEVAEEVGPVASQSQVTLKAQSSGSLRRCENGVVSCSTHR